MARITELSPSMFSACRCAISFAFADGIFCKDERKIIDEYFKFLGFSDEQRKIIANDIKKGGVDFDTELKNITDHRARAYFINLARILSYADGEFCVHERALLDRIRGNHLNNLNFGTTKQPDVFSMSSQSNDCKIHRDSNLGGTPTPSIGTNKTDYKDVSLIEPETIINIGKEFGTAIKNPIKNRDGIALSAEAQKLREFSIKNSKEPKKNRPDTDRNVETSGIEEFLMDDSYSTTESITGFFNYLLECILEI